MLKNRWALQLAWLWLCGFGCLYLANADTSNYDSPFIVDVWSTEEGLPQSSVISVIQTKDGYLWLGTLNGLVRFDGNRFTVFDQFNTPGLSSDRIVSLFEDSRTNFWIWTESSGLDLVKGGKVETFKATSGASGERLPYIYEDESSNIWFYAADGHFFSYQNGRMIFYDPSIFPAQLFEQAVKINIPSPSGGFWRMENGSIQKWENNQLEKDFGTCPWTNASVTSACEDANGNLIVGTLGAGVFWFDASGKYERISKDEGLSSDYVLSLCMDREGNLWVGTDGGGLDRIKRKKFNTPRELHPWDAQSLSEDAYGGLWVAFGAQGASYWKTNSAQDFHISQYHDAWEVLVDNQQQVWAGTRDNGLFLFQTNHFIPATTEILGPQIYALFEDHGGQLWVGAQNGLGCWNGQNWKIYTTQDGLSENTVRAIVEDFAGNFWVGTQNAGLNFFRNGKSISYRKSENGLPGDDISCLYLDKDGVLWVGTSGHGLARFQNGIWTRYSTDDGLISNSIGYIIEDDDGNLWIGSNAGLMRIQKKSLDDFASGATNVISCRTYVETDGLPTRECSSGSQPAACRTSDGRMWFPTTKGLVSVNPADLKPNLQPPTVMIESALVNGAKKTNRLDSAQPQAIVVPPGHNQLEIDYTALSFSAPNEVHFKYRLEGRETAWTPGDARVAHYNELLPGQYRFHVISCNEDGVWNENGSILEITVQPQFWQTRWFLAMVIVVFLGMVIAVVRYFSTLKLQRQLQLLKQQEALERERSRIARDLHDQLGANLTQVALLGEMAESDKNSPDEIESHAKQISETARETTHSLDEIVWAINPSNDTLEGLANYACKYAQEYLALAGVRYRVDLPTQLPPTPIPPEVRHNVFLAFKEAVNNVVKHAQATEVWIRLRLQLGGFTLEIEDNGRGIGNQSAPQNRNGLRNMKRRMDDIHGEFSIAGGANGGTIVRLKIPLMKK